MEILTGQEVHWATEANTMEYLEFHKNELSGQNWNIGNYLVLTVWDNNNTCFTTADKSSSKVIKSGECKGSSAEYGLQALIVCLPHRSRHPLPQVTVVVEAGN